MHSGDTSLPVTFVVEDGMGPIVSATMLLVFAGIMDIGRITHLPFHHVYGQLRDGLETYHTCAQQHIELVIAVSLLLFKVIGGPAHRDQGRALAVEILCDTAHSSW